MPGEILASPPMGIGDTLFGIGSPVSAAMGIWDRVPMVLFVGVNGYAYAVPWIEIGGPFVIEDRLSTSGEPFISLIYVGSTPIEVILIKFTT